MIRRKAKRPGNGNDGGRTAPANPTSATGAPAKDSLPPGGDEPPPTVINELLAAFSLEDGSAPPKPSRRPPEGTVPPKAAGAKIDLNSPEVAELLAPPSFSSGRPGSPEPEMPTQATRAMSPTEMVEQAGLSPPPEPALEQDLLPEPTRRSVRRSKREAKREAKREKKRVAEHNKSQKKAQKQTRKARRKGKVKGSPPFGDGVQSDVRIITPDEAATLHPQAPSSTGVPPAPAAGARKSPAIQIAGDDLPDVVYVEGDLGAGGSAEIGPGGSSRSTVFIDEDPSHADVVTMDVATSATRMEPRMRERRIAVRRAVGRRRLKWAAIVAAVVLIVVASLAVLGSDLFKIKEVRIEGRVYSGGPAFDAVVEELDGANVLRADTDGAEQELERIPWVVDARVTTDFPSGATVEVRERVPSVAFQGPDGRYRVLDRDGRVLDVIDGQPTAYLELIVIDGSDLNAGELAPRGYRAAATLAQALTPEMRQWVRSLSASADGTDLRMKIDGAAVAGAPGAEIEVRFGAAEDLVDKLVRLQTALTDPDPENPPTEWIDVSTNDIVDR